MSEMKVHYVQKSALYYFIIIFLCVFEEKQASTKTLHASEVVMYHQFTPKLVVVLR